MSAVTRAWRASLRVLHDPAPRLVAHEEVGEADELGVANAAW